MAETEDDVSKNQFALTEEERELPTSSGTGIGKLFQVENEVQAVTEEPDETVKTNSQVEIANESIAADNLEHIEGEQFSKSPLLDEIAGEKSSSSAQVQNGKDMANEADKENSKTNLTAEGDSVYEEAEIKGANIPGTQLHAEESRDLSTHETICVVQEDNIMKSQEATADQNTEIENHVDDAAQDMITKSPVTSNQDAYQQNTSNTLTASFQDLHEVDLQIKKETDLATTSSSLDSKEIEPQGLSSSQNVNDETTEDVQKSLAHTRNFSSGIVCKSDQTEIGKEVSQDTKPLAPTFQLEDATEKIELLREVSTEAEYKDSTCSETTEEVECLSEHTGNVSTETECAKEHKEKIEGNPQDAESVMQSTKINNATAKKIEISPDLAENVSTGVGSGPDNCEMTEGNYEDQTTLLHSAILEEGTTGKVENLSEHTIIVSEGTECCSDPSKGLKENNQDDEKLSQPVNAQDENTQKAGNLPDFATNVSVDIEDRSNYIAEETSDDVEMNTLGAEPGEISCEVKSTDDGKEKEILELERSEIGSTTDAVSSTSNYSNKSAKEDVENSSYQEQVSSPVITTLTTEVLLKDAGPENVPENTIHSGNIFEKEDSETEATSCTEPAPVKELSDMVPVATEENQDETENQNMFQEDVGTDNGNETVMSKAKEIPESSSNDVAIEERETLEKESQEQVHVEPLAGEHVHNEVSKGVTEINIEVEEQVKPEISNTQKDLEALLPKNEPKKETLNEFLQEASGPIQKIDSSQHVDRTNYAQVQISTELLEGDLCEEKDSPSSASKSKEDNSITNTMVDGSSKEIDYAVPNDTAQETYETEGNDSEEGAPQPKEDQVTAEGVYKDFCKDEEKEMQIKNKDEVTKEYLIEVSAEDENKLDHEVRTEAMNYEADDIHEREAVYRNDAEDIKESNSMEGALALKDQISGEQVDKDTSEKDDKKEIHVIDANAVDTASVESSCKEEKLSDHEVTTEIKNTKGDEFHQEKVDQLNHNEETEGNSEEAPEPRAYQIAVEEVFKSTNTKGDELHQEKVDQRNHNEETEGNSEEAPEPKAYQIAAEEVFRVRSLVQVNMILSTNTKGDELHQEKVDQLNHNKETEGSSKEAPEPRAYQIAAEEVFKSTNTKGDELHQEKVDQLNHNEETEGNSEEAREPKVYQIAAEESTNTKGDELHQGKVDQLNHNEETEGNSEEAPEPKAYQITAEEIKNTKGDDFHQEKVDPLNHNKEAEGSSEEGPEQKTYQIEVEEDTIFNKDEAETKQIMDEQEMAAKSLTESSIIEENKLHYKLETEPINPEADDIHKQEAFFSNDDEKMKSHIEEKAENIKQDQIMETEEHMDILSRDLKNGPQILDKEVAATITLAEDENFDLEVTAEVKNPEADEFREGNEEIKVNDSGVTKSKDQIAAETHRDMFTQEEKEIKMMNEEVSTENPLKSSVEEEQESGHKVIEEETILDFDELQKGKADHIKDDQDPKGSDLDEEVPEPNDHTAAEKIDKETFSMDEVNEAQIIDKETVATEHLEEENKSSHEAMQHEADDVNKEETVHKNGDEGEPVIRKDQILDEEECQDTFSKDQNKDTNTEAKELEAIEYLEEPYIANENKSDHEITTKDTNQGGDDDEEIIGNDPDEIAAELKVDHIAEEKVMQVQNDKNGDDAEKETQIIEEQEVAKEYSVDPCVADFNKSNDKATTSETDDVSKQEVYTKNNKKAERIDTEKAEPEQKYQILAEEACKDEEDAQTIEKREVAIEYSIESIVVEESTSGPMDKIEVKSLELDDLHKEKADHPDDGQGNEANDPTKVATELLNEDHMAEEAFEDISSKDVEKITQITDREKETNQEVSDIHYGAENIEPVEETTTQHELQEPVSEDIIADKIMTSVPNLEKIKEFQPEHDFETSSAEETKAENSCEESQQAELDREGIHQHHDIEKQIVKETDYSNDCLPKSPEKEIIQENLQEDEASKQKGTNTQMNKEEILNMPIPISMQGERLMEEKSDVMEPETETKDVDIEGTTQNATANKQEEENLKVKNEGNTLFNAGTDRLAERSSPREYLKHPENFDSGVETCENNEVRKFDTLELEKMQPLEGRLKKEEQDALESHGKGTNDAGLESIINTDRVTHSAQYKETDIMQEGNAEVIAEGCPPGEYQEQAANFVTPLEGSLKQEEWDSMEPKKETRELDTTGTTENEDITLIAQECGTENTDAASTPTLKDKMPLRENEKIAENSTPVPDISKETDKIMLDATEAAEVTPLEETLNQQEHFITEQEKETRELHIECITQEDDPNHTAESSRQMTDASEEWNEKTLDTTELAETRSVEGTLEQEERVVMEQKKEIKHLHTGVTTQNEDAINSTEEGEEIMLKHEEVINAAPNSNISEALEPKEYQEQLENPSSDPELSNQSRERMPDTMEKEAIRSVERSMKQDEWDALEPEKDEEETEMKNVMDEANVDAAGDTEDFTVLTEALPPSECQEWAENLNPVSQISEQTKEKILDLKVSTEINLVDENLKQEDWDVMKNNLDREDTAQNDEVTLPVKEDEKDTIKQEGHPDDACTDALGEKLSTRNHQEHAETPNAEPENFNQRNEKMLDTKELLEANPIEETLKQEQVVMEQENDERYSHVERTTENSEAFNTAQEGQKETVKCEKNLDAAETYGLTEGLATREFQELTETSIVMPNISEEINETILESIGTKESKLIEGISKKTEWDAIEPEKETRDVDRQDIIQKDEVTLTAKQQERDIVEHVKNPDASSTEELPPREYNEVQNDKLLDTIGKEDKATLSAKASQKVTIKPEGNPEDASTTGLTEELPTKECEEQTGNSVVLPKQKEWEVKGQEKEAGENVVRNEENANAADENRIGEELIPREQQELTENSGEEKISEIAESTETIQVEILKPEEWCIIEPVKEIRNLDTESTKQNDVMLSAQDGEKEMVKLKGHPDAEGTGMLIEGLALRECQEHPENFTATLEIPEDSKEKILESEMIQGKEGLKHKKWDAMQQEKEIKDLDEGTTLEHKATIYEQDAALTERLTEGLLPREYQEHAEKSCDVPKVYEEKNEITLKTTESLEIKPVERRSKQEGWDVTEPEEVMRALESKDTLWNHEAMHSEHRSTIKTDRPKGHPDAAGIDMLTEGIPAREYQELPENSSAGEELDAIEPEKETKDLDSTAQNDTTSLLVGEGATETVKHDGNQDAADNNRQTEGLPPGEHQEFAENTSIVAETFEERDEKLVDAIGSTVMNPIEGISKQDEWSNKEPKKETKEFHIEETTPNDNATHSAHGVGNMEIKNQGNANSAGTDRLAEEFRQIEYQELVKNLTAEHDMSGVENDKMIDLKTSKVTISVEGSTKPNEWDVLEPQKKIKDADIEGRIMDKEAADLTPEGVNFTVENEGDTIDPVRVSEGLSQAEFKELAQISSAIPEASEKSKEKMVANMVSTAVIEDAKEIQVQEHLQLDNSTSTPDEVDQEDAPKPEVQPISKTVDSHSENTTTDVKTLNAMDKCCKVLQAETDRESQAQENINTKDTGVNSSSASSPSVVVITAGESPEQLRESIVYEDKQVQSVNETNEVHKKDEDATNTDTNILNLLVHETPRCSPDESTYNIQKKHEVVNLEDEDDDTENAGILLTATSEHEQIQATEKTEQNHTTVETESTTQELQQITMENIDTVGSDLEVKAPSPTVVETTLASSMPRETSSSLHDLIQTSKKDMIAGEADDSLIETEQFVAKSKAKNEEAVTEEEREGEEEEAHDSPVTVEVPSDIDVKAAQKKSHNILSGVGSKVKQSIKKVKKAITGKSSHPKPTSPK